MTDTQVEIFTEAINNLAQAVKVLANAISCDESLDHALGRASMKISDAINYIER